MAIQRRLRAVRQASSKKKKTLPERIEAVAKLLYYEAYEADFGGKTRGKFLVDREQLKQLLDLKRLHPPTLMKFADECLEWGIVLTDMDEKIGFAEVRYVENWRKLPSRLIEEYVSSMYSENGESSDDEEEEEEDDDADTDDED
jgi:hypothetical protein